MDEKKTFIPNSYETPSSHQAPPPYEPSNTFQNTLTPNTYGIQMFDVHYYAWRQYITIVNPVTEQVVYKLQGSGCRGRFEITNAQGQLLGATKTSSLTSKIEVEMADQYGQQVHFEIKNNKVLGIGSPRYQSPAFGAEMTWENTAFSRDIIYTLMQGKGTALAKFQSNRQLEIGKLEIVDPSLDNAKMNEVIVILMTLLRRKLKQIQDATTAAIVS